MSEKTKNENDEFDEGKVTTVGCSLIMFPLSLFFLSLALDPRLQVAGVVVFFMTYLIAFKLAEDNGHHFIEGAGMVMVVGYAGGFLVLGLVRIGLERLDWLIDLIL